jgi:RimJ/RimL family protein N-acetyltransferase
MYTIESTEDFELIKELMTDEKLFKASMPDEEFQLLEEGYWEPNPDYDYVVVYKDNSPLGLVRYSRISNITVDAHHQLLSKYWGQDEIKNIDNLFVHYLLEFTGYRKIMVRIPTDCTHTLKAAAKLGYQIEGVLTDAVIWRNRLNHIVIMSKSINL